MNGTTTDYSYDGAGNQVSGTTNGSTTTNLWDTAGSLPQLVNDGSNSYLQANGVQEAIDSGNTASYPLTDALGSVRGITDSSGTLTGTTSYDAFGAARDQSGSSLPLGYTGQLTDPGTGFIDLWARELDPTIGRFLSSDTVQPNAPGSQGYNLYAYVANNPTTWTDPSGHAAGSIFDNAGSVIAACLASRPCGGALEVLVAGAATSFAVGDVLLGVGITVAIVLLLVVCALAQPCWNTANDINLIVNTYGGGQVTGGGNRPPSPATCVWDAVKGWAESVGNAADGIRACATAIRNSASTPVRAIRGGSGPVIPQKAYEVYDFAKAHNWAAPPFFVGNKVYKNIPPYLPPEGNYREYDVNKHVKGVDRGWERIVVDISTGKAWYTSNHYGGHPDGNPPFIPMN